MRKVAPRFARISDVLLRALFSCVLVALAACNERQETAALENPPDLPSYVENLRVGKTDAGEILDFDYGDLHFRLPTRPRGLQALRNGQAPFVLGLTWPEGRVLSGGEAADSLHVVDITLRPLRVPRSDSLSRRQRESLAQLAAQPSPRSTPAVKLLEERDKNGIPFRFLFADATRLRADGSRPIALCTPVTVDRARAPDYAPCEVRAFLSPRVEYIYSFDISHLRDWPRMEQAVASYLQGLSSPRT